jgi:hypothetical protein
MVNIIDYIVVGLLIVIVIRVLINLKKKGISCGGSCDGCDGCSGSSYSKETQEERQKRRLEEFDKMGKF